MYPSSVSRDIALRTVAGLTRKRGLFANPSEGTGEAVCTYSSTSRLRMVEVRVDSIGFATNSGHDRAEASRSFFEISIAFTGVSNPNK